MTRPYVDPREDSGLLLDSELREPRRFRVLLHNDDYTTMEFVIAVLREIFHKTQEEATAVMLSVHEKGIGQCGVYTHEIAETKVTQVHTRARRAGFPLKCTLEEVE